MTYLRFQSFLGITMVQVVEKVFPMENYLVQQLQISWQCEKPRYQGIDTIFLENYSISTRMIDYSHH